MVPERVRLIVRDEPFAGARVRAAVETIAGEHGLPERAVFELKVAATEALANAVRHGGPPVEVTLECRDDAILVEVLDHGEYSKPTAADPERGRGVPLMGALADVVELDRGPGWTRLRLRKRLYGNGCDQRLSA